MGDSRKPIFVTPANRRAQNRTAQRRFRAKRKAEQEDRNPMLARAAAAERDERGAAVALGRILGEPFDAERIFRSLSRYRAAFQERMATTKALESVKLRVRRMETGANPLLHVDLLGR